MWFVYALLHVFLLALVNYTDEHLATNNKLPKASNVHTRVGSVLLISTLMSFVGALLIALTGSIQLPSNALVLAILSAVPMVITYASYFYLIQKYPIHQFAPLFQISSIWLLLFELLSGESISATGVAGIVVLMYGAYILDAGTFKWKIPTKLLMVAIPATSTWAITLFLVKIASRDALPSAITFWQMIAIGLIGVVLFIVVKRYREGFIFRVQNQRKRFLSFSLANETFAEIGYLFGNMAVAIAPVAAFVTAMSGVQSLFVLLLLFFFPQGKRTTITKMQWIAVLLIAAGVFLIEL